MEKSIFQGRSEFSFRFDGKEMIEDILLEISESRRDTEVCLKGRLRAGDLKGKPTHRGGWLKP